MTTNFGKDYMMEKILFAAGYMGNSDGKIDNSDADKDARDYIESAFVLAKENLSDADKEVIKNDSKIIETGIKLDEILGAEWSNAKGTETVDKVQEVEETPDKPAENKVKSNEEKFAARYKELAKVSDEELEDATLFRHSFLGLRTVTMQDILMKDYLNKDLAEDKDGKLTEYVKNGFIAEYKKDHPEATQENIQTYLEENKNNINLMVQTEKANRQGRFNEDGTYNLQELGRMVIGANPDDWDDGVSADAINKYTKTVGADYTLNQSKGNWLQTEHSNVMGVFTQEVLPDIGRHGDYYQAELGIGEGKFEKKDRKAAENIVRFFGGDVEKVNFWGRLVGDNEPMDHAGDQAVANVITQLANPFAYVEQNQVTNIVTGGVVDEVVQHQLVVTGPLNAAIALVTSIGVGMVEAGIDNYFGKLKDEDVVIKDDPLGGNKPTTLKGFIDAVDADKSGDIFGKDPVVRNALKDLATKFVYDICIGAKKDEKGEIVKDENGNTVYEYKQVFDYDSMYAYLRQLGGNDKINMKEFLKGYISEQGQARLESAVNTMLEEAKQSSECKECDEVQKTKEPAPVETKEEPTPENGLKAERGIKYVVKDLRHSGWKKISQAYDCLKAAEYQKSRQDARTKVWFNPAERIMKLVQCIEDKDYSKERIDALLNILTTAKTRKEFEAAVKELNGNGENGKINFNFAEYYALLDPKGHPLPSKKTRLPLELMGCPLEDIDFSIKKAKDPKPIKSGAGVKEDKADHAYKDANQKWVIDTTENQSEYNAEKRQDYKKVPWSQTGIK